jgi:hypothetical protein
MSHGCNKLAWCRALAELTPERLQNAVSGEPSFQFLALLEGIGMSSRGVLLRERRDFEKIDVERVLAAGNFDDVVACFQLRGTGQLHFLSCAAGSEIPIPHASRSLGALKGSRCTTNGLAVRD